MKQWLARSILRLFGWRLEGIAPEARRFVLIAAPHTSNWDFPLMLLYAWSFGVKVNWLAKHTLFFPGAGMIMRALGGIPVVRHRNRNMVDTMVQAFKDNAELILVIPTEGTRALTEYWKSGFYHIAVGAQVPIIPSFLDWGPRRGGFGPALNPTGDLGQDMHFFREFYAGMRGRFDGQFGPVRLREEELAD